MKDTWGYLEVKSNKIDYYNRDFAITCINDEIFVGPTHTSGINKFLFKNSNNQLGTNWNRPLVSKKDNMTITQKNDLEIINKNIIGFIFYFFILLMFRPFELEHYLQIVYPCQ